MIRLVLALFSICSIISCSSAYYATMEKFGYQKRDLLVSRVGDARDEQEEAKEVFVSALERFSEVVKFDGGDLEDIYDRLSSSLEESEGQAEAVRKRIDSVETVAEDLFEEWEDELDLYSDGNLKADSKRQLQETKAKYKPLIASMRRAEKSMEPVLVVFRDQVLYLKHNLNARAIGSLRNELPGIQRDVASLVAKMEASIQESERFIEEAL